MTVGNASKSRHTDIWMFLKFFFELIVFLSNIQSRNHSKITISRTLYEIFLIFSVSTIVTFKEIKYNLKETFPKSQAL